MERHSAAREARQEFARVLNLLKTEGGIERQRVAEMLGVPPPTVSRMAAPEVRDRPTFAPPSGWQTVLAPHLRDLAARVLRIADTLDPPSPSPDTQQVEPAPPPPRAPAPSALAAVVPYTKERQTRKKMVKG